MKVRCKRCGESFLVDPAPPSGEVYACQGETAHATPLTGERNESSVLFSLAALAKQAHAPRAPDTAGVTESSALIDIRALVSATPKADAETSRADDIVNLSGGGAFAPLFAPPLVPPVTFVPAENEKASRFTKGPIVIGGMALAVVAMVGITAFALVGSRSSARAETAVASATAVSAPTDVPSAAGPAPSMTSATAANEAPQASPASPASSAKLRVTSVKPATTSTVSAASPPKAAPKCCPNESEIACHMRLSTGGTCGVEPPASTATPAPSFDRPAAARALGGINVAACKRAGGPTGPGHVRVTFQPSGSVSAVDVDAPYAGTTTGACVAQRYRSASVPAFSGGPLSVGKSFAIE